MAENLNSVQLQYNSLDIRTNKLAHKSHVHSRNKTKIIAKSQNNVLRQLIQQNKTKLQYTDYIITRGTDDNSCTSICYVLVCYRQVSEQFMKLNEPAHYLNQLHYTNKLMFISWQCKTLLSTTTENQSHICVNLYVYLCAIFV